MNPKVHWFDYTVEAYDRSQTQDDIKNGDVLVIPLQRVAAVLYGAWPIIAAGDDPDNGMVLHTFEPGKDWPNMENGTDYLPSVHLARYVLYSLEAEIMMEPFCKKEAFLSDPITRYYGVGSDFVDKIDCYCMRCRGEGR